MIHSLRRLPHRWRTASIIAAIDTVLPAIGVVIGLYSSDYTIVPGAILRFAIGALILFYVLRQNKTAVAIGLALSAFTAMVTLIIWIYTLTHNEWTPTAVIILPAMTCFYILASVIYGRCLFTK